MLDDLQVIKQKDPQDALGNVAGQWKQLQQTYDVSFKPKDEIRNVVLAGMGGSALGGVFLQSWPGLPLPFEIVRNYSLPGYVGQNTLVILSSYSGNTEETLAALTDAENRKAQLVVLSNGGKLTELASQKSLPLIKTPVVPQPRMSAFYIFNAITQVLTASGVLADKTSELNEAGQWLSGQMSSWTADIPTSANQAKQIAQELMGKTVIIYSGPAMSPAVIKWKIWINENAKNLAWFNQYPEFNHNEFIGWSGHPIQKPFAVVEIRSNLEHERVRKRFEVSERLLSGKRPAPIVIKPQGDTVLKQLLYSATLGDFVSIYLAILNGVNPTPVDLVEKFKTALNE